MEIQRVWFSLQCSLRIGFIVVTNLYCIPTYLLWMWFFFLPLRILNFPTYWYVEGVMYQWLLNVVASWSYGAKYRIVQVGEEIDSCIDDRCLFLVNHQSTADVPFLMQAFSEKSSILQSVMWIMDRLFRYTNFGAVSVTHGDYFITQGKNVRDYQMKKLRDHLLNIFIGRNRRWIILFPEGGFLCKRKETSVKYAQKNNFPILYRVTLPRTGAMHVIIDTLRPEKIQEALDNEEVTLIQGTEEEYAPLKWIIDVTIAYPDQQKPLDLLAICAASRPPCITYMHFRRYAIEDVPYQNSDSLRDWLYDRWSEKEELLDEYYSTKKFPLLPKRQQACKVKADCLLDSEDALEKSTDFLLEDQSPVQKDTNSLQKSAESLPKSIDSVQENTHSVQEGPDTLQRSTEFPERAHVVTMSQSWIVILHFFFISSTVFHCYLLRKMWNYIHI